MAGGQRLAEQRDLDADWQPIKVGALTRHMAVDDGDAHGPDARKRPRLAKRRRGVLTRWLRRERSRFAHEGAQVRVFELLDAPMRQAALAEEAKSLLAHG